MRIEVTTKIIFKMPEEEAAYNVARKAIYPGSVVSKVVTGDRAELSILTIDEKTAVQFKPNCLTCRHTELSMILEPCASCHAYSNWERKKRYYG